MKKVIMNIAAYFGLSVFAIFMLLLADSKFNPAVMFDKVCNVIEWLFPLCC